MRRIAIAITALAAFVGLAFGAAPAYAQSGHFIENGAGAPVCTDEGTTVECTGKVAGLGGTTFEITIAADGHRVGGVHKPGRKRCSGSGHGRQCGRYHGAAADAAERPVRVHH